jgi:hypothetical protein
LRRLSPSTIIALTPHCPPSHLRMHFGRNREAFRPFVAQGNTHRPLYANMLSLSPHNSMKNCDTFSLSPSATSTARQRTRSAITPATAPA